jgi:dGTP triphosphohydrolase
MAYGHVGEKTLDKFLQNNFNLSFEGNANNFVKLEKSKIFDNVSNDAKMYVYASLAKHKEELYSSQNFVQKYIDICIESELRYIKKYLPSVSQLKKTLQCQIMDISDEISYTISDIVDSTNVLKYKELKNIFRSKLPVKYSRKLIKTLYCKSSFRKTLNEFYYLFCDNYTLNSNGEIIPINMEIEELKNTLAMITKQHILVNDKVEMLRKTEVKELNFVINKLYSANNEVLFKLLDSRFYKENLSFFPKNKNFILRDYIGSLTDKGLKKIIKRIKKCY